MFSLMNEAEVIKIASRFLNGAGRLQAVPVKQEKKIELLDFVSLKFELDHRYSEKEVNEILKELYDDFPYLRRLLIENDYLDRNSATGTYWKLERISPDANKV